MRSVMPLMSPLVPSDHPATSQPALLLVSRPNGLAKKKPKNKTRKINKKERSPQLVLISLKSEIPRTRRKRKRERKVGKMMLRSLIKRTKRVTSPKLRKTRSD